MTEQPTLVFDLDGTLIDTAPDLVSTLNWVLAREGHPPMDYELARNMIGHGARGMLEAAYERAGRTVSESVMDRLFDDFIDRYQPRMAEASRPFDGTVAALDRFLAAGWTLAICTNKQEGLARQLMAELALADRFATICGGDTFDVRKPHARHLTGTVLRAGGNPARAVRGRVLRLGRASLRTDFRGRPAGSRRRGGGGRKWPRTSASSCRRSSPGFRATAGS